MQPIINNVSISRWRNITEAVFVAKKNAMKHGYAGAYIDNDGYVIVSAEDCNAARPAFEDHVVLFDFTKNFAMNTLTSEDWMAFSH